MGKLHVVTGGGGFIGVNLVQKLLELGNKVIILDKHGTGYNAPRVAELLNFYNSHEINLTNIKVRVDTQEIDPVIDTLLNAGDLNIYHLASESHVDRSIEDPIAFAESNFLGTCRMLEVLRRHPHKVKLMVVSTDEVYGDEAEFPTALNAKYNPSSPYSASKAAADLMAKAYRRTFNLPVKISICCNNFGPHQHREKFIPTILQSILSKSAIPVYGDGKQIRQWVPVQEHCIRLTEFMNSDDLDQHVGGLSMPNIDLINLISEIAGVEVNVQHIKDRPGHDKKYELKDTKAITKESFVKYLKEYIQREMSYG